MAATWQAAAREAAAVLVRAGLPSAAREARLLVAHALQRPAASLLSADDGAITAAQLADVRRCGPRPPPSRVWMFPAP
jgi:hypothetical protein